MVFRASLELTNEDVVFVGIGLPNLACNLARQTHAPDLFMIYESGAVGAVPDRLPVSIGDPCLVTGAISVVSQSDIFHGFLQRGNIQVGFLGGAQIDRYGNINTTVVGDYDQPQVRLPGSGGACEIATHSEKILIVMKMSPRSFVKECDFVTSPGHRYQGKTRKELGLPGGGPSKVITDLGVCDFIEGEMTLTEIYPGVKEEDVQKACGWDLKISDSLKEIELPSSQILTLLRDELDPQRLYLK
ncbi:MAG: 3-oxoadipate--succinyl-CoA transferase subunit B [Bdellovibrionaceae bacterium]|nr:3-oxoadipate--succinyl-CoA transferase subunit B [Pseudobdellovibrionaceae bacterium]